jgi:hypothetical protein
MSEYTPDTASLRYAWRKYRDQVAAKGNMSAYSTEFDSWLAGHDAEVKADAWDEGFYRGVHLSVDPNPYREVVK